MSRRLNRTVLFSLCIETVWVCQPGDARRVSCGSFQTHGQRVRDWGHDDVKYGQKSFKNAPLNGLLSKTM